MDVIEQIQVERRNLSRRTLVASGALLATAVILSACSQQAAAPSQAAAKSEGSPSNAPVDSAGDALLTPGTSEYRGFTLDNVYHSPDNGDVHFNLYIPDSYDGGEPYALFVTLPGYEGLYFQGVGVNLRAEEFGFTAQEHVADMIVAAPQLNDWGKTSANQTVALVEYLMEAYEIDPARVYIEGFSVGGETMSLALEARPDLFADALHVSSQWDGDLAAVADARLPLRFFIGESDSYYGSEPAKTAYDELVNLYRQQGLSDAQIAELTVLDVKDAEYFAQRGHSDQHTGGGAAATDVEVMEWLFAHIQTEKGYER